MSEETEVPQVDEPQADEQVIEGMLIRTYPNGTVEKFKYVPPVEPEPRAQTLTKLSFRRLFTLQERAAWEMFETQTDNPELKAQWRVFNRDFDLAQDISLNDPDTIAGVSLMEQVGIIGEGRAAEILSHDAQ